MAATIVLLWTLGEIGTMKTSGSCGLQWTGVEYCQTQRKQLNDIKDQRNSNQVPTNCNTWVSCLSVGKCICTNLRKRLCRGQQDVLRLQITVDDVLEVKMPQGYQDLQTQQSQTE